MTPSTFFDGCTPQQGVCTFKAILTAAARDGGADAADPVRHQRRQPCPTTWRPSPPRYAPNWRTGFPVWTRGSTGAQSVFTPTTTATWPWPTAWCRHSGRRHESSRAPSTGMGNGAATPTSPPSSRSCAAKMEYDCMVAATNLKKLRKKLPRFVSETANIDTGQQPALCGQKRLLPTRAAFMCSAIMKEPQGLRTHRDPELVGNKRRVLISDLSGPQQRGPTRCRELGINTDTEHFARGPPGRVRADQDALELERIPVRRGGRLLQNRDGKAFRTCITPLFDLLSFRVIQWKKRPGPALHGPCDHQDRRRRVGELETTTAAEGDGPVSALDNGPANGHCRVLSRILWAWTPCSLVDFKVRVLDGRDGTSPPRSGCWIDSTGRRRGVAAPSACQRRHH